MKSLKKAGLIKTQPRMLILDIFEAQEKKHLSTNDIYMALQRNKTPLSLGTIYRVVNQFEKSGLIQSHHFSPDNAVYELCAADNHDHMIDIRTGKIVEFHDEIIEKRQKEIAEEYGLELVDHKFILYGYFN
jgi:Fur family ferric uptake transcriptional regulator